MNEPVPTNTSAAPHDGNPPRLALRAKDAALALGISERLLWSLTNQGAIPHIRLGRVLLYPVAGLRRWLDEQSGSGTKR
jgi:predicted DNA-binding transcriptional regulator AlpA